MKRALVALAVLSAAVPAGAHALASPPHALRDVDGLRATLTDSAVHLTWASAGDVVLRDDAVIAHVGHGARSFDDRDAAPGQLHRYRVATLATVARNRTVALRTPSYKVGAASRDITP